MSGRLLIADTHPATVVGLRTTFEAAGWTIVAEVADESSTVAVARRERPDLCLLDQDLPGVLVAVRAIDAALPDTRTIVLAARAAEPDVIGALEAGARGHLCKDVEPEALLAAAEVVLSGDVVIPGTVVDELLRLRRSRVLRRRVLEELSEREWEVVELLLGEHSTREIAERLFISPATVRSHVASIAAKLGAPDRRAVVDLVRRLETGVG